MTTATSTTAGTNQPDTWSASRWIGARLRCASPTMRTIRASSVSAPTRSARITSAPVPLTVAPMTRSPGFFSTGIGSPVTIDSSTALAPSIDDAVDRHLLAGPDAQPVADLHLVERHVLLAAVGTEAARGLRRQPEQGPDRGAGAAARPQLEHLAEEDQRDDHRRRLEVGADLAVLVAEGGGEEAGREPRGDAVEVGHADAEGDQREHVEAAVDERVPAADEERPAAPEHDRRGEQELEPAEGAVRQEPRERIARQHHPHRQDDQRQGEHGAHPEAPRHVAQLGVLLLPGRPRRHRGSRAMPQIGQHPGAARTTSGCIGQVHSVPAAAAGGGAGGGGGAAAWCSCPAAACGAA